MKLVIVIARMYWAAIVIARQRGYAEEDWYWCASRPIADRWIARSAAMGCDIEPTFIDKHTALDERTAEQEAA